MSSAWAVPGLRRIARVAANTASAFVCSASAGCPNGIRHPVRPAVGPAAGPSPPARPRALPGAECVGRLPAGVPEEHAPPHLARRQRGRFRAEGADFRPYGPDRDAVPSEATPRHRIDDRETDLDDLAHRPRRRLRLPASGDDVDDVQQAGCVGHGGERTGPTPGPAPGFPWAASLTRGTHAGARLPRRRAPACGLPGPRPHFEPRKGTGAPARESQLRPASQTLPPGARPCR
ncbi:hypothetical protein DSC45_12310 [Streptomyces sp. YIM 130001]|nr:hypothetical protein DSC45_12310 [Streptomyces sp. YIM 130001]